MDTEQERPAQNSENNVDKAARLFADHHAFIRGVIGYFIDKPDEQEELYQDLFVFFVKKPVPEDVVSIEGWLYRTILNRIRDKKRQQSRYTTLIQAYGQDRLDKDTRSRRPAVDPQQIEALFSLIKHHLPSNEARAMLYRYKDHLSIQDIARQMKVKSTSVSRYLAVGRSKLKGLLNKDDK